MKEKMIKDPLNADMQTTKQLHNCENSLTKGQHLQNPQERILSLLIKTGKNNKLRVNKIPLQTGLSVATVNGVLKSMKENNLVEIDRHGRVNIKIPDNAVIGTVFTSPAGAGFVKSFEGETFYIPKSLMKTAVHKDKVLIAPTIKPIKEKNKEGVVLYVLEHGIDKVVGTYIPSENGRYGFIIPDDNRINFDLYIGKNYTNGAHPYDKVVANIVKFPNTPGKKPVGEIIQVIGMAGDLEAEQESVIKSFDLPEKFPNEVMKEAQVFDKDKPENWDLSHRTDFREKTIITIDCDTSKDLDDAISLKKTDKGYELGVYIADVAHYVREDTALDKEALKRGNSTYLLNEVVPMLPTILSNNLCSLNPHVDRLVLGVIMNLDLNGDVVSHTISEGVIRSSDRLNYTEVSNALDGVDDGSFVSQHGQEIYDMLECGKELSQKLFKKRIARGSVEFDIPETEIVLDEKGNCIDIKPSQRRIANDMIEEFMLLTNETIAKEFFEKKIPFVFRVHPAPFSSKLETFENMAKNYGIECPNFSSKDITSKDLQLFLENIEENEMASPIKMMLLQSMKQARYSEILTPHFGLAAQYYCHFTSPIRRYPDLMIHRIIKMYLRGVFCNDAIKDRYTKICSEVAKQASKTERTSDQAEKEVIRNKAFEYISQHMDIEYTGFIRSMNKVGMFISLDNSLDGFIKDKTYSFNSEKYICTIKGKEYHLGDKITVKAHAINQNTKEVLFLII